MSDRVYTSTHYEGNFAYNTAKSNEMVQLISRLPNRNDRPVWAVRGEQGYLYIEYEENLKDSHYNETESIDVSSESISSERMCRCCHSKIREYETSYTLKLTRHTNPETNGECELDPICLNCYNSIMHFIRNAPNHC